MHDYTKIGKIINNELQRIRIERIQHIREKYPDGDISAAADMFERYGILKRPAHGSEAIGILAKFVDFTRFIKSDIDGDINIEFNITGESLRRFKAEFDLGDEVGIVIWKVEDQDNERERNGDHLTDAQIRRRCEWRTQKDIKTFRSNKNAT